MSKALRWIVALGSALFFVTVLAYVRPQFIYVVLVVLVCLAVIVLQSIALWMGVSKWRKVSNLWPIPALVCFGFILCTFYFASSIGRNISDHSFLKRRGDYVRVVDDFRKGVVQCTSSCNEDFRPIDATSLPPNIRGVYGTHCSAGGVIVLFSLKTDVPLLHTGYMFKDYAEGDVCSKRFGTHEFISPHLPFVRRVAGHWYRFSDEPGF
jgi:hypothetical protein